MISVELWRARIEGFNRKGCSSGSSPVNSLFFHCCTNKDVQSQEDDSTSPTAQTERPYSAVASTVALSSRLYRISEPEKHTANNVSAELGFLSAISIKQLHSPSHFSLSYSSSSSPSSSDLSRDNVFQYHSSQLRDVLIILLTVIAVISQLLIISGDIETNPGPVRGGE